ncbi:C40 family peptidase [Mycetohabitans sp. B5]|uniref:Cell wall-associated NlpC family hydrolase n=1 Tax=Mycetohabitans endofungorum TaxID=417203 RepID=A0A2P5KBM8_9BURK|nr:MULTISPECIES: C40 family peptidase [Mycetohabitans]MCG1054414.1 C40 family peptidase [Mycetohabitans sp. B5]PPB84123.1 cell wall-associated NlpC family hydrolase [Mycetohabitans endofungorum]
MRLSWIALAPCSIAVLLAACSNVQPPVTRGDEAPAGGYRTHPSSGLGFVDHSVGQEEVSIQAMSLVGVRYRWGGNTPSSGFDCSGLVRYVLARSAAVELPRTTAEMSQRGRPIQPNKIAPGDLVFFNTSGRPHSHVGIYVGNMRFVNAPSTGGTVRIDYVTNPYWAKRFDGIRRVAPIRNAPKRPFDAPTLLAASAPPTPSAGTSSTMYAAGEAASGRDAFEPPSVSLARTQTRGVGAVEPDPIGAMAATGDTSFDAFEPPSPTAATARSQAASWITAPVMSAAPDPAGATASAAPAAGSQDYGADTPMATPAQAAAANDPIARFAHGNF